MSERCHSCTEGPALEEGIGGNGKVVLHTNLTRLRILQLKHPSYTEPNSSTQFFVQKISEGVSVHKCGDGKGNCEMRLPFSMLTLGRDIH